MSKAIKILYFCGYAHLRPFEMIIGTKALFFDEVKAKSKMHIVWLKRLNWL